MINQRLIAYYINSLSLPEAMRLASNHGVILTEEEARTVLPFLKKRRYDLRAEKKESLLEEIKTEVSETTFQKLVTLIDRLIK